MYKFIFAAIIIAVFNMTPVSSVAKPSSTSIEKTEVKKKIVKKSIKKRVKKVVKKKKPNKQIASSVVQKSHVDTSHLDESTSHGFFAAEMIRNQNKRNIPTTSEINKPTKVSIAKDNRNLVAKNCNIFTCGNTSKVVVEAKKWEGKHARTDRKELANLMKDGNNQKPVDPVRIPWCAGFVNAILARTGHETTESLQARSFLSWGEKTKNPKVGDIVILTRGKSRYTGHVGFFEGYEWDGSALYVKVLGGNQNKSVNVAYFPVTKVLGYRTANS